MVKLISGKVARPKLDEQSDVVGRFRRLYLAAVCDALYQLGLPEQVLPSRLRPLLPEQRMVGFAYTLTARGIAQMSWDEGVERIRSYLEIFERLPPDSVIVHKNDDTLVGHFGELTGNAARGRGCVGVVLEGNLRDVEQLRAIDFQVFYRDVSPLNAIGRWEMVADQVPVEIGGVTVNPGDLVFGEFEGILIVPSADLGRVLEAAEEIVAAEGNVRSEVRAGATPLESFARHGHI